MPFIVVFLFSLLPEDLRSRNQDGTSAVDPDTDLANGMQLQGQRAGSALCIVENGVKVIGAGSENAARHR